MALIICPECKKEISDTAESCPGCGYKLSPEKASNKEEEDPSLTRLRLKQKNEKEQEEKNLSIVVQIIAVIFIVGIIYSCSGSKGETASAVEAVEVEPQAVEIASVALYKKGFPVCISELLLDNWTKGNASTRIPMLNTYCYVVNFDREVSNVKSHGDNKVSFDYLDKGEFYGYEDGIQK